MSWKSILPRIAIIYIGLLVAILAVIKWDRKKWGPM
jgi:L-asparagine transporter-like permease